MDLGVTEVVSDAGQLTSFNLEVIIELAGFGTNTSYAIESVRRGGRVVQVGLERSEATISTFRLAMGETTLVGSRGGTPAGIAAVLSLIGSGALTIATQTIDRNDVNEGLDRLAGRR